MAGPGICVVCLADTCTSEVHLVFNPVVPYGYLLSDMYLFMADITNPDFLVVWNSHHQSGGVGGEWAWTRVIASISWGSCSHHHIQVHLNVTFLDPTRYTFQPNNSTYTTHTHSRT